VRTALRRLAKLLPHPKPLPDFVGYEVLIDFLRTRHIYRLPGDLLEVGAFMGGGTAKLARFARKHGKRVFAIDIFEPAADTTPMPDGTTMASIYLAFLEGRPQRDVYRETTRRCNNIVTICQDSMKVTFPPEQRFCFAFIDGNHDLDHIRSDFRLAWTHLVSGGVLGLHDYGTELPGVTDCIDSLVEAHRHEIAGRHEIPDRHILLLVKRPRPDD